MRRIILATAIAIIIPSISMAKTRTTEESLASVKRTVETADAIGECQGKVQGTFKKLSGKLIGKMNDGSYAAFSYTNITKNGVDQNITCSINPMNRKTLAV